MANEDFAVNKCKVVVVDDDPDILKLLARILRQKFDVVTLSDTQDLASVLADASVDVVLTDLNMPGLGGIELCEQVKRTRSDVEVLVMTGAGSIESAVQAMRAGAYDFLTKPFSEPEIIEMTILKALEHKRLVARAHSLEKQVALSSRFPKIVGTSDKMKKVVGMIDSVAKSGAAILIVGESGTGKELIAHEIHEQSDRRAKPFVALNCAALTETLLESELFGHTKGSFTGATGDRRGLIQEADRGTLFLDEIGEMPLGTQAKMLRVLESGEAKAVGSNDVKKFDIRIVSATNINFKDAIKEGRFRQDLFYRINVITLELPALRDRVEDIPLLAYSFLKKHALKMGKKIDSVDPTAMQVLVNYDWPGNVRELAHVIERAVVLTQTTSITLSALPEEIVSSPSVSSNPGQEISYTFGMPYMTAKSAAVSAFEKVYLTDILSRAEGNIAAAARMADLDRSNFRRLLVKYGIKLP